MRKREFETERGALRYWVSENDEETAQLVFLPGLTADHRLFNKQVDYFSQRARCLVWDPPSHHVVFYRLRRQKLGQLQKLTLTQGVEFSFFAPKGVVDGPRKLNRTENTRSESQLSFSAQAASYNYK